MANVFKDLGRRVRQIRLQLSGGQSKGKQPTTRTTQLGDATTSAPIHRETNDIDSLTEENSYGIKVLHNSASAFVDIVFVHGLTGNAHRTWFDKESGVLWPRDLLSLDLVDARIMTFGYDADIVNFLKYAAQDSISGYANDLLGGLAGRRKDVRLRGARREEGYIALSRESRFSHLRDIERQTTGIIFLGTPHHGADLAKWGSIFAEIANLATPANKRVVKMLQKESDTLAGVQDAFHNVLEYRKEERNKIALICFYETIPLFNSIVVPRESAIIPGELHFPIRKNHKDMMKCPDKNDKGYQDILREIQLITDDPAFTQFWDALGQESIAEHLRHTPIPLHGTFTWSRERLQLDKTTIESHAPRILRITGKPGCGKSVLAAHLYRWAKEQTPKESKMTSIFYAFSGRDTTRLSPSAMLASLTKQLFRSKEHRLLLKQYYNRNLNAGNLFANSLQQVFRWACSLPSFGPIVCIIDALDECNPGLERDELVTDLEALLCSSENVNLTLILLNRDYWELSFENVDLPEQSVIHVSLDKEVNTQQDLQAFTNACVEGLLRKRPKYEPFRTNLTDKLFDRASNGMFLMVLLVIDLLLRSTDSSPRGIDHTIQTLPSTLHEVYRRIWESIDPSKKPQAETIMSWIVAAFQPVAVETLSDALAHESLLDSDNDELKIEDVRSGDLKGDLRRLFGPLVWIEDTVEWTHQTAKEFFLVKAPDSARNVSISPMLPGNRHIKIAATCLFCLTRNYDPKFSDATSIDTILGFDIPPFYAYAKAYCSLHYDFAKQSRENKEAINKFERMYYLSKRLAREHNHPWQSKSTGEESASYHPSDDEIGSRLSSRLPFDLKQSKEGDPDNRLWRSIEKFARDDTTSAYEISQSWIKPFKPVELPDIEINLDNLSVSSRQFDDEDMYGDDRLRQNPSLITLPLAGSSFKPAE